MWQPSSSIATLQKRAEILKTIRQFFEALGVLEIEVPVLAQHSVSDPYLDALSVKLGAETQYLQTSPEYYMKRLLAAGSGSIYSLGKAFRADEQGRIHSAEFSMLEWYRLGFNEEALIDEIFALVRTLDPQIALEKVSYQTVFEQHLGCDPHRASADDLALIAKQRLDIDWPNEEKNTWLDLLFTHCIESKLGDAFVAVYDYPASQCALARLKHNSQGQEVAARFECFYRGVELANGYWELKDAAEQTRRFALDNEKRKALQKAEVEPDPYLLQALEHGLPDCAGVALGIDRLVMVLLGLDNIGEQRSF